MSDSTTHYIHPTPTPPPEPETYYTEKGVVVTHSETTDSQDLNKKSIPILPIKASDIKTRINVVKYIAIIVKFLKELDGRDKSMKIIQYFIKILLHYHLVSGKQWSTITSHFSMTRKLLRLGNFMGPYKELTTSSHLSLYDGIVLLNAFINSVADDVFCYYKLGFCGKHLGARAERIAAYCWFAGIIFDLRENQASRKKIQKECKQKAVSASELIALQDKLFVAEISKFKLLMDGIFCACDIWQPSYSPGVQVWSGFLSGSLAGWKLWIKLSS
ncbi:hypothetical protein K501DRAFT_259482 [Backusella circina FSU 941]|nr:hypothetical protein K501DRAFT_259482 [Backusella circina FSU 941]